MIIASCELSDSDRGATLTNELNTTTITQDTDDDLLTIVMKRGILRVALEAIYKPDSFLDNFGNIIGFNPTVIEEVARRLGIDRVEYVNPPLKSS